MKKIFFSIFLIPVLAFAGDPGSGIESQNQNESTKLSLYVPGFLMKMGSWFVPREKEPEVKEALNKMRSISICVREGCAYKDYNASGKFEKKMRQLENQNVEELLTVRSEDDNVSIGV